MAKQTIESTCIIKFLDDKIFQAKGVVKKEKAAALQRCRDIMYGYYLTQDDFRPAQEEVIDLFGETEEPAEINLFG